jgi:cytochrome c oxidase cbb3-type subunit III
MKTLRDLAIVAAIAGIAAYQGRQLHIYAASAQAAPPAVTQNAGPSHGGATGPTASPQAIEAGAGLFQQNCAFCHGRDAGGGETGPDLTRSKLVTADVGGDKIGDVVLHGRAEKGMPAFPFSAEQITNLAAFIHSQQTKAMSQSGKRKGVDVADLQTGNVEAGKTYFNGAGGCASCHSPTGDLAGIASRYEGLQLEERMLYPKDVKSKVAVTLPSGQTLSGILEYKDEFTLGMRDATGKYHSWRIEDVKYKIDAPVEAHVAQFPKYSDDDIHNLMAYIQTLR